MAYTVKTLARAQPGTTSTTLYTVPASKHALVKSILICNVSASNVTLQLASVASGGALADNNTFFKASVMAGSTIAFDTLLTLAAGETLRALVSTLVSGANPITIIVNGVEQT